MEMLPLPTLYDAATCAWICPAVTGVACFVSSTVCKSRMIAGREKERGGD